MGGESESAAVAREEEGIDEATEASGGTAAGKEWAVVWGSEGGRAQEEKVAGTEAKFDGCVRGDRDGGGATAGNIVFNGGEETSVVGEHVWVEGKDGWVFKLGGGYVW